MNFARASGATLRSSVPVLTLLVQELLLPPPVQLLPPPISRLPSEGRFWLCVPDWDWGACVGWVCWLLAPGRSES